MPPAPDPETRVLRCPVCRKAAADAYRPFCSKRCADIDLGKWLSGSYAIAGRDDEEDGEGEGLDRDARDVDED